MRLEPGTCVVHGPVWDGGFSVFLLESVARELAGTYRALDAARTWGDLRRALSPVRVLEAASHLPDDPDDEEPFDALAHPDVQDGTWPPAPADLPDDWAPLDVRSFFRGTGGAVVPRADVPLVVAALERHGVRVREDAELVDAASGIF